MTRAKLRKIRDREQAELLEALRKVEAHAMSLPKWKRLDLMEQAWRAVGASYAVGVVASDLA